MKLSSLQGPLVGIRQSSQAIASEYANADPVYVQKTAVSKDLDSAGSCQLTALQALPQKFSHYRTVRGDGNCGWRGKSLQWS